MGRKESFVQLPKPWTHTLCQNGVNSFKPMEHLLVGRLSAITRGTANKLGIHIVERRPVDGMQFPNREERGH